MTPTMYDLTDPTTRATVQEIRKQAIAEAATALAEYLRRWGVPRDDAAMMIDLITSLADNPSKP